MSKRPFLYPEGVPPGPRHEHTIYVTPPVQTACDFCAGSPVTTKYACPQIGITALAFGEADVDYMTQEFSGAWYACANCSALILTGNLGGLRTYAFARNPVFRDDPLGLALQYTATLWVQFLEVHGPPTPCDPHGQEIPHDARPVGESPLRSHNRSKRRRDERHGAAAGAPGAHRRPDGGVGQGDHSELEPPAG